jgi:hypothetical protein
VQKRMRPKIPKQRLVAALLALLVVAGMWYGLESRQSNLLDVEDWSSNDFESLSRLPPLSESVFTLASDKARTAVETKSYKKAAALIVAMGGWRGMSSQQLVAYRNSIRNVKVALATAALDGDTNAVQALDFLKSKAAGAR